MCEKLRVNMIYDQGIQKLKQPGKFGKIEVRNNH